MKIAMRSLSLAMLMFFCASYSLAQSDFGDDTHSQSDSIANVINYFPIADDIGTAGQPTPEQFALVKAAKYSAVINLAVPQSTNALPNEKQIVTDLGMSYRHIPVPWDAPNASHVKEFFETMDKLTQQADSILVHCAANYRASVFTYKYLTLKKGVSEEEATTPLLKEWLPEMDENWKTIMALSLSDIERSILMGEEGEG
jgi:protein tyrosine phosphatase (PTP) superfamily phosphohydrolase (DUF442 family)